MVGVRTDFVQTSVVLCCSARSLQWQDGGLGFHGWTPGKRQFFFWGGWGCSSLRQDGRIPHQLSLKLVPEAFSSDVNRELTDHLDLGSSRG